LLKFLKLHEALISFALSKNYCQHLQLAKQRSERTEQATSNANGTAHTQTAETETTAAKR